MLASYSGDPAQRTTGRILPVGGGGNLLRLIDFLPGGYLLGVAVMLIDRSERRIGESCRRHGGGA